ncbi:MAG TPA: hypothetical protein PLF23_10615 [Candidatus Obscuribacter sp.]|nr:hypothetical protein [Candidatus Obscuribacter sp.]
MKISIGGGWGGFVRNGAVGVLLALSVSLSFGSSVLPVHSKDFHAPFSADGFFQEFWSSSAAASGSELANLLERQLAARQSTVDYSLRSSIYARFLAGAAGRLSRSDWSELYLKFRGAGSTPFHLSRNLEWHFADQFYRLLCSEEKSSKERILRALEYSTDCNIYPVTIQDLSRDGRYSIEILRTLHNEHQYLCQVKDRQSGRIASCAVCAVPYNGALPVGIGSIGRVPADTLKSYSFSQFTYDDSTNNLIGYERPANSVSVHIPSRTVFKDQEGSSLPLLVVRSANVVLPFGATANSVALVPNEIEPLRDSDGLRITEVVVTNESPGDLLYQVTEGGKPDRVLSSRTVSPGESAQIAGDFPPFD